MRDYHFYIDVVGSCNLKCPSCPVGNSKEIKNPKSLMSLEMMDQIMKKATRECNVTGVSLYNWTEPLLHPRLPELIQLVQAYGVPCAISTNLNILKDPDGLMEANPNSLYVSVSGFSQAIYGVHHAKGDIGVVKANIERLLESRSRTNAATEITMIFHRYLNNLDEEPLVRKFAEDHELNFLSYWAQMMPMEKILAYEYGGNEFPEINDEDQRVLNHLALPLKEALDKAKKFKKRKCSFLTNQIVLDAYGNVALCCTVYDINKYGIGKFLSLPLKDIQKKRMNHEMCKKCTEAGAHIYSTCDELIFDEIAIQNFEKHSE